MLSRLMKPVLCSLLAVACFAFAGCLQIAPPPAQAKTELNFANVDRLHEHWQKHVLRQKEWGTVFSRDEYLAKARAFFNSPPESKQMFTDVDGDSVQYKSSTNEFGVLSAKKVIRTFFRPRDGQRYFDRQKNR